MKMIIEKGTAKNKKLKAIFYDDKGKKIKTVQFGLKGSSTYIDHKDKKLRSRYIERHRKNENWNDPMSAGALSRYLLWGQSVALKTNISNYKKKFNLK
tara:strand:- start:269 stop:562 length:294 start_codon:yes stop_codon:yes gene_type:complete